MDKLEPILKHHFWILLVPLLSMNLWGYFSANSALSAATSARQTALDGVKSKIPTGQNDPNEQYAEELKTQNDALEKFVKEELQQLWLRQQARMTWPQAVAADIPKGYRSEVTDNLVRFAYQNVYFQDVIKPLHESVEPMVLNTKDLTYVPKVDFPPNLIPQMKVGNFTITSTQMWDAQEDVWVTQLILDAIRQMNKDADSTSSAVIRRVIAYRLLGGDGTPVTGGAAGATGDSSGMMSMMPGDMEGSSGVPSGGGGGRSSVKTSVKFNPAEEFGTGGEALTSGNGMSGGPMMSSMMPTETEGGDGSATESSEVLRYVKFDPTSTYEAAPFMERGFYLSVIINQNRLVDFLVALSNSDWPIKVARFHIGKNPYRTDEFKSSGTAGGSLASGGGMMSSMMAPGFDTSSPMPFGSGDPNSSMLEDYPSSGLPGGMGGGAGANTGYKVTDLDHPDLIQLDLAGLVTIFRDPSAAAAADGATTEEAPADGTPPADATAGEATPPADGTAPATAEATVPMPADAAAATPASDTSTAQPGATEPAVESPTTSEPAATEPATTEPAAAEPAKPDPAEPPANP